MQHNHNIPGIISQPQSGLDKLFMRIFLSPNGPTGWTDRLDRSVGPTVESYLSLIRESCSIPYERSLMFTHDPHPRTKMVSTSQHLLQSLRWICIWKKQTKFSLLNTMTVWLWLGINNGWSAIDLFHTTTARVQLGAEGPARSIDRNNSKHTRARVSAWRHQANIARTIYRRRYTVFQQNENLFFHLIR